MKYFVFFLLLVTSAHAQETKKLNPFIIKAGDCMNGVKPGYTCYSESDTKILDGNQNDLLKCQAELFKAKPNVTVKKIYDCPMVPDVVTTQKKSNHIWLKIGLGVLLGFGVGLGVGLSQ